MIYSRHPDVAWREVVDETLIVDPRNGRIYPLNPVASYVWKRLDGTRDLDSIQKGILEEFEISEEEAARDLQEFVEQVKQAGLVLQS